MFKSAGLMQGGGGFNVTTKPLSGNPLIWACQMELANMAVGESHLRLYDSLDLFEEVLGAPEAAAGKVNLFQHFILI